MQWGGQMSAKSCPASMLGGSGHTTRCCILFVSSQIREGRVFFAVCFKRRSKLNEAVDAGTQAPQPVTPSAWTDPHSAAR